MKKNYILLLLIIIVGVFIMTSIGIIYKKVDNSKENKSYISNKVNNYEYKEIVKDIRKMAEESKVAIRSIRREGMDEVKEKQKSGEITEDEQKSGENQIQKITDNKIAEIDKVAEAKEKEVMSI